MIDDEFLAKIETMQVELGGEAHPGSELIRLARLGLWAKTYGVQGFRLLRASSDKMTFEVAMKALAALPEGTA